MRGMRASCFTSTSCLVLCVVVVVEVSFQRAGCKHKAGRAFLSCVPSSFVPLRKQSACVAPATRKRIKQAPLPSVCLCFFPQHISHFHQHSHKRIALAAQQQRHHLASAAQPRRKMETPTKKPKHTKPKALVCNRCIPHLNTNLARAFLMGLACASQRTLTCFAC